MFYYILLLAYKMVCIGIFLFLPHLKLPVYIYMAENVFFFSNSYSVVNGRSGTLDTQTSFIGCDHKEVQYKLLI